jgi:hypothetical protein
VPPLVDGERLTRDEFECRYDAMPGLKKAELIDSHALSRAPRPARRPTLVPRRLAVGLSGRHSGRPVRRRQQHPARPGQYAQPDGLLIIRPEHSGRVQIGAAGYVEGGPELVGEVSSSTADDDLGGKRAAYLRNEAQEYIVWRVLDRAVDWFVRRGERYEHLEPGADGITRQRLRRSRRR